MLGLLQVVGLAVWVVVLLGLVVLMVLFTGLLVSYGISCVWLRVLGRFGCFVGFVIWLLCCVALCVWRCCVAGTCCLLVSC